MAERSIPKSCKDTKTDTLLPIICRKIAPDSVVYTDCHQSYNVLDVSEFGEPAVPPSPASITAPISWNKNLGHINGIEAALRVWSQAKRVRKNL